MGAFITEEILSEGGITGTSVSATTITGGTFYGDGSNLTGVSSGGSFTGGTVTGATIFTGGLSANTFSATTINGDGSNLTGVVLTSRNINTSSPLSGGGDLTVDRTISISQSNTATDGYLSSTDWNTFNNKVPTGRTISTTSPLSGGGDLSTNRTLSIDNAAADGTTKGAATFTASDFVDNGGGLISIDYANGQAASSSDKGFLTSTDWTTFNGKQDLLTAGYGITNIPNIKVSLTSTQVFATATTSINSQNWIDVTGVSVSLAAGTWLIIGHIVGASTNVIMQGFTSIRDGANNVIAESAIFKPASAAGALNIVTSVTLQAIVSPVSTTTYKLSAARALTTNTQTWTVYDGSGFNTANQASNNSDKGTNILAIRIS